MATSRPTPLPLRTTGTTTVSTKYQVVIPREIRDQLKLKPGQTLYMDRISDTEVRLSTRSIIDRYAGTFGDLWGSDPMNWLKRERSSSDRFV